MILRQQSVAKNRHRHERRDSSEKAPEKITVHDLDAIVSLKIRPESRRKLAAQQLG